MFVFELLTSKGTQGATAQELSFWV